MLFKRRCEQSSKNEIMNYFLEVNLGDQSKSLLLQLRGGCTEGTRLHWDPFWISCQPVSILTLLLKMASCHHRHRPLARTASGISASAGSRLESWQSKADSNRSSVREPLRHNGSDPLDWIHGLIHTTQTSRRIYVVWPSYDAPVKLLTIN